MKKAWINTTHFSSQKLMGSLVVGIMSFIPRMRRAHRAGSLRMRRRVMRGQVVSPDQKSPPANHASPPLSWTPSERLTIKVLRH